MSSCTFWTRTRSVQLLDVQAHSGGPWFSGNTAYGITVAEVGDKALYMAINYIDILDVSVLTH